MSDVVNNNWKYAKLSWLCPIIGYGIAILFSSSPSGGYIFTVSIFLGVVFTFLCFINIKKYPNTLKHGILGMLIFLLILFMSLDLYRKRSGCGFKEVHIIELNK